MKIAVRLDDITPDMDWEQFFRMKELLDRHGICPLIGVVPDNKDSNLHRNQPKEGFYPYLHTLQEAGWSIAMHGYAHVYSTGKGGLFPLNRFSEFAGVPLERQRQMIRKGKQLLEKNGILTDIFMAPAHSYDRNTLKALQEAGFRFVTDGFGRYPYRYRGLTFLPISANRRRDLHRKDGFTTLVIHPNTVSEEGFAEYEKLLEELDGSWIDYGVYLRQPPRRRLPAGRLRERLMAGGKRLAVQAVSRLRQNKDR